jgi:hypothetical protein
MCLCSEAVSELRQHEDLVEARVQAVADRDVDETVVAREGHRRLAAILGQGVEAGAAAAPMMMLMTRGREGMAG